MMKRSRSTRRATTRALMLESLETRRQLSAVPWTAQPPLSASDASGPRDLRLVDLDGDLDLDLAVASVYDSRVGWYENLDGRGTFGPYQMVTDRAQGVSALAAADLDGDHDADLLVVVGAENRVVWWENVSHGHFGAERLISNQVYAGRSVQAGDVDGDGDLDVITTSGDDYDSDVSWYENIDGRGAFGAPRLISATVERPESAILADLDGDGDLDAASASYNDNRIAWYANLDGRGNFGDAQFVDQLIAANELLAADIDGDHDLDLIAGSFYDPGPLVWYENNNGHGAFDAAQVIDGALQNVEQIQAVDLDVDGDLDLVTESVFAGSVLWYENIDGRGQFADAVPFVDQWGNITSIAAGDVDQDGTQDVAFASLTFDEVVWIADVLGGQLQPQVVSAHGSLGPDSVVAIDVDGDGDLDAAAASVLGSELSWFENLDGRGLFGPAQSIDANLPAAIHLVATDLNGDARPDVLATGNGGRLTWYANRGDGSFSAAQVISEQLFGSEFSTAADLDGDGDLDVLATVTYEANAQVRWFANLDGQGTFSAGEPLTSDLNSPREVAAQDYDADGDIDLALVSVYENKIVLLRNDGHAQFAPWQAFISTQASPMAIAAADIDGDVDQDLVVIDFNGNDVALLRNDGQGRFAEPVTLGAVAAGPESLALADVDGDGDNDVLISAVVDDSLTWLENVDGRGQFAAPVVIDDQVPGASSIAAADLDGDGDLDLLATAYDLSRVLWYRNDLQSPADINADGRVDAADLDLICAAIRSGATDRRLDFDTDGQISWDDQAYVVTHIIGTNVGDANLDGVFDSNDLVLVFVAGEYEDERADNSGWEQGDWDCDGEFTTTDLVAAFQQGGYVA